MPTWTVGLVALLALGSPGSSGPVAPSPINAIAGDASWIASHGHAPAVDAPEDTRIHTHLAWVEARLRAVPTHHLDADARLARARMLDALHAYAEARAYPRHSTHVGGRRPRFVDAAGRHCAVAALVRASAGVELVEAIRARHELDFVRDMHEPALVAWARANGLTLAELGLIQPSYADGSGVDIPSPAEEQRRAEERARLARVPRPLPIDAVRSVVERLRSDELAEACAGERTGHFTVSERVRVDTTVHVQASVQVTLRGSTTRETAIEACIAQTIIAAVDALTASAAYRVALPLTVRHQTAMDVWSAAEIEDAVLHDHRSWHAAETRTERLASCFVPTPADASVRVPIRIAAGRGDVTIRWDEVPDHPMRSGEPLRTRWYCIQDVVTYDRYAEHGAHDYLLVLEIARDGTVRIVRP